MRQTSHLFNSCEQLVLFLLHSARVAREARQVFCFLCYYSGLVIESFEKQKYFSNVRSPVVELHPVPLTKAYFAKDNADLQGNCHEKGMGDQWSLTTGDVINFNSDYIAKIKRFST